MGRMKRLRSCTALLASFLVVFGHSPALAQVTYDRGGNESVAERDRPGYDPLGLRWGGFDVRPALDVGVTHTDNLFADDNNARSDYVYFVRPSVAVESHWSRHRLAFDAHVEDVSHQDFSSEDRTTGGAGLDARVDVRRTTQIGGAVRYAQAVESRADPDAPDNAAEPVDYKAKSARLYVQQQFNRMRFSVAADHTELDYDDVVDGGGVTIEQDDRDHEARSITVRGEFAVSPRVAVLAQASANERDYDLVFPAVPWNRNSDGATYLIGANFDLTRLIRGEVAAGYFEQDYEDPAVGDTDGLAVEANLDWFPSQLTTVNFRGARRVEDSGTDFAASYLHTSGGVRVDHELLRNVILSVGVDGVHREYRGISREDDVVAADLGLRYLMNRRVVLSGGYRYEEQTSTGADRDRDFEINRFFLSLGLRI